MKKVLLLLVAVCLLIGCGQSGTNNDNAAQGASSEQNVESNETSGATDSLQTAKEAYAGLGVVATGADLVMTSVYKAWAYSIDDAQDEHYRYMSMFAKDVGLDNDKAEKAYYEVIKGTLYDRYKEMYDNGDILMYDGMMRGLTDASIVIDTVMHYYQNDGYLDLLSESLAESKEKIQKVSQENPNASYLQDLKDYYTKVELYKDFALSPSGSFIELSSRMEEFRTDIKEYQSKLSFDLE